MKWTLGQVESMLKTEEQISIIFAVGVRRRADAGLGLDHPADDRQAAGGAGGGDARRRGGRSGRRIPVETVDEVGRLSQGFNRMLERLSQADAQIRAFNQRLAAEIEAATHDLSEKNATLAQLNRLLNDMRLDNASKVRLATLGQLAAQLAHEIGTPLSSVSGHMQLALLQRDLPAALRERLDVSAREIERISKIVRDYLDSTRPLEPEREPTALPRLLEEAVEIVRGVGAARRARRRSTGRSTPASARWSPIPGLLRQIVVNLLIQRARRRRPQTAHVELEAAAPWTTTCSSRSATPGTASRPTTCAASSSRSTRPRGAARGPGSAWRSAAQLTAALGGTISVESDAGQGLDVLRPHPAQGPPRRPRRSPAKRAARRRRTRVSDDGIVTARAGRRGRPRRARSARARSCAAKATRSRRSTTARAPSSARRRRRPLRPGRLRRAHGAVGRLRRAGGVHREGAGDAGHPDHRVRRRHRRDGGDPARRLRLRLEAVQHRGAAR